MSLINITNIVVKNNPCQFRSPFEFEVTFECMEALQDEIEWNITYVGSAMDEQYDQLLDSFSMGPLEQGTMQFALEVEAPDHTKIPSCDDLIGVTALIISVSFHKKEFFRAGYYICNQYELDEEQNQETEQGLQSVAEVEIEKVTRNILTDKVRTTRFDIDWNKNAAEHQQQSYADIIQEMNQINDQMHTNHCNSIFQNTNTIY